MDVNFLTNVNYISEFNDTKAYYEQKVNEYITEMIRIKNDAEMVNTHLKKQVKKINLLKSIGVKTCINKYMLNMKYLKIKCDENKKVDEYKLVEVNIKPINFKSFEEFITFDRKNIIQRAASMMFRRKVINEKITEWEKQTNDLIIKNQVLILEQYNLLENLYNKRLQIKGVIEQISEIEGEFTEKKDRIEQAIRKKYSKEKAPELLILENYTELINSIIND